MIDMKNIGKGVITGPSGSYKSTAINMNTETKKAFAKNAAEANMKQVDKGAVKYKTRGTPDFHIEGISFGAEVYITLDKQEQRILDDCVKRKLLNVVQDNR